MLQVASSCILIWKKLENVEAADCASAQFALLATIVLRVYLVHRVHVPPDDEL
jgi:hypothetical protein